LTTDRLTELRTRTYNAQGIAGQLKGFVRTFPELDQGEKNLWLELLVEYVEVAENKRVAASLRPPFAFGFMSPDLALRGAKPQVPQLRIHIEYNLGAYYRPSGPEGSAETSEARYSFAPESSGGTADRRCGAVCDAADLAASRGRP
jgi:hypothetical protein